MQTLALTFFCFRRFRSYDTVLYQFHSIGSSAEFCVVPIFGDLHAERGFEIRPNENDQREKGGFRRGSSFRWRQLAYYSEIGGWLKFDNQKSSHGRRRESGFRIYPIVDRNVQQMRHALQFIEQKVSLLFSFWWLVNS